MAAKKAVDPIEELQAEGLLAKATDPVFDLHRVSTGIPPLDTALGGGYAFGRNVLCVGPESTGKTVLAQYSAAAVQRLDPAYHALLVDAEMSFDRSWWERSGVDIERLYVLQPVSGEQAVDSIIKLLKGAPNIMHVTLDSIATLSPTAVQEKAAGERTVASLANLVNNLYLKLLPANKARKDPALFFAINQLRDNMTGYDDVYPGGRTQRFNSHVLLRTRREGWIKDAKDQRIGYVMEIHVRKNKLGSPETEVQIPFLFGEQVDMLTTYLDEAIAMKVITTGGPYYYLGEEKWLGKGALRLFFQENPERFDALKRQLEEAA